MTIGSILKNWLGVEGKIVKLDHDMKNNRFGSLSVTLLTVNLALKIGGNRSEIGY